MKKIASIIIATVLIVSFIPVSNVSAKELIKLDEGVTKRIEARSLACDCGGTLLSRVVYTAKWTYSSSRVCTHNLKGSDYIYKRRVVTAYDCNRCSFYDDLDTVQTKVECKGV